MQNRRFGAECGSHYPRTNSGNARPPKVRNWVIGMLLAVVAMLLYLAIFVRLS